MWRWCGLGRLGRARRGESDEKEVGLRKGKGMTGRVKWTSRMQYFRHITAGQVNNFCHCICAATR